MLKISKEEIKLNIIPCIMLILSIIIGLTDSENIRKVLLCMVTFLLGIQVQKAIYIIRKRNGDKNECREDRKNRIHSIRATNKY